MKELFFFVVIAVLAGFSHTQNGGLEIDIEFNPCKSMSCSEGQTCRVIAHKKLLQVPVAMCVDIEDTGKDSDLCISVSEGTNVLNCKTRDEWMDIASIRCNTKSLTLYTANVFYHCHNNKYLKVDYTCCSTAPGDTPPVITTTPPGTTEPTLGTDDATTVQTKAITPSEATEKTITVDNIEQTTQTNTSVADKKDSNDLKNSTNLVFFLVLSIIGLIILVMAFLIYRQRNKAAQKRNASKTPHTVFINPHCDDYKVLFESPSYTDLSSYNAAPEKFH